MLLSRSLPHRAPSPPPLSAPSTEPLLARGWRTWPDYLTTVVARSAWVAHWCLDLYADFNGVAALLYRFNAAVDCLILDARPRYVPTFTLRPSTFIHQPCPPQARPNRINNTMVKITGMAQEPFKPKGTTANTARRMREPARLTRMRSRKASKRRARPWRRQD